MRRKRYTSDLTDEEWAILEPLIPLAKEGGWPRTTNMRDVVDAIFYVLKTGCQWANLPGDFPPYSTVFDYYNQWRKNKVWQPLNDTLRETVRKEEGRDPTPSAAVLDSQTVKTTEKGGPRGFDGGKLIKGRKRFILVDTLGLLLKVLVTEANIGERQGADWLLTSVAGRFPRLKLVWVDGGFAGQEFEARMQQECGIKIEVVQRPAGAKGFVLLVRRWVVERTFAWFGNYRRLSKDYEYSVYSADAMIYAAMIHLMLRRLGRQRPT